MTTCQEIVTTPRYLDRKTVEAALADYILQVNRKGYHPDKKKVLAVRGTDRTAWLRTAETPVRWEVYYFIEGELFPKEGATKLPENLTPEAFATELTNSIWEQLWVWNGYDFTPTSYGLNHMLSYISPEMAADKEGQNAGK